MDLRPRVGIVYAPGMASVLREIPEAFDVVEVEPQTLSPALAGFAHAGPPTADDLAAVAEFPHVKVAHSVGMPFGNAESPTAAQYAALRFASDALESAWVSDHLSFNHDAGKFAGFLLPLPQTRDAVEAAAVRIRQFRTAVRRPVLFETGANYLRPQAGEMTDGAFFRSVAIEADCGILLDLHNLWTNERNGRQSVMDTVAEIPAERVIELHLAGGHERGGYWLDAHSDLTPPDLLRLAEQVIPRLPNLRQLTFEMSPEYFLERGLTKNDLFAHLQELRWLARDASRVRWMPDSADEASTSAAEEWRRELVQWKHSLTLMVNGEHGGPSTLASDPGVQLYRDLIATGRSGQLAGVLPLTLRLVLLRGGASSLDSMIARFREQTWPSLLPLGEARAFLKFLELGGQPPTEVIQVARFEIAALESASDGISRTVEFTVEPLTFLTELGAGRLPRYEPAGHQYELRIEPDG